MENQNDRITTKHKTHQKSTNMPVYRMQITFKMSPRRRSKMTKPKSQIYRMQSPLKWILEEVKNLMREKTEMPVPTPERLPWLLSTLSENPIYLLFGNLLPLCSCSDSPSIVLWNWLFCALRKKLHHRPQMSPEVWHMKSPILNLMLPHCLTNQVKL